MELDEYQKFTRTTAVYPRVFIEDPATKQLQEANWVYPALGLGGENGEILEKIKKIIRDKHGRLEAMSREAIKGELSDLAWYWSQLATEFGFTLSEILDHNVQKLQSRKERGVLQGSGDNR